MGSVKIDTKKATVIKLHPFRTAQGYGADVFIEAKSDISTAYLQIVVYDEQAETAMRILHVDDVVDVSGELKLKKYARKDGSSGFSVIIEKPALFDRIDPCGRIEQIVPFQPTYQPSTHAAAAVAAPSCAETAEQDDEYEFPF
jgi:single-stranded DNA-binding protein